VLEAMWLLHSFCTLIRLSCIGITIAPALLRSFVPNVCSTPFGSKSAIISVSIATTRVKGSLCFGHVCTRLNAGRCCAPCKCRPSLMLVSNLLQQLERANKAWLVVSICPCMHAELLETGRFSLHHVIRLSPGKAHACTLPSRLNIGDCCIESCSPNQKGYVQGWLLSLRWLAYMNPL
jgi:hypothetical protein